MSEFFIDHFLILAPGNLEITEGIEYQLYAIFCTFSIENYLLRRRLAKCKGARQRRSKEAGTLQRKNVLNLISQWLKVKKINATVYSSTLKLSTLPTLIIFPYRNFKV